jgi:hypothetical protein
MECGNDPGSCSGAVVDCGAGACVAECDERAEPARMDGCDEACDCVEC